jgi:membrane-associated phospholipid phosphatase
MSCSSDIRGRAVLGRWRPVTRAAGGLAVVGAALLLLGLVLGVLLIGRHGGGAVQGWDVRVWHWSVRHRWHLVGVAQLIAVVGDAAVFGPICVVASAAMFWVRRSPAALGPVTAYLGGEGMVFLIRSVIHRHRPPTAVYPSPGALPGTHDTSFSFPSGHSVAVTAVLVGMLGLLALTQHRRWPWLLAVLGAAFVADSRLVLGVHWFSDVAIGLVLGLGWGVAVALTLHALDARCAAQPDRTAAVAVAN